MNEAPLDPLIQNYLERSLDILLSADSESLLAEMAIEPFSYSLGRLTAVMRFSGGRRLGLRMLVEVIRDRAVLQRYSMHFMDDSDDTIFRYDNSPHFHGGDADHKHEGAAVFLCERPSVRQIRNEIAEYLNANA